MDSSTIFVILIILALFFVWNYTRQKNSGNLKLDATAAIISDINTNLKILEVRQADPMSKKKFSDGNWRRFGERLIFLDKTLVSSLNETFAMVEDFNSRIDAAKKSRNLAALQDLPLANLKELLSTSQRGLNDWLRANMQSELQRTKKRNFLGF